MRGAKLSEKLKEKEKELMMKEEEHERLQNEHNQFLQKMQKENNDLQG